MALRVNSNITNHLVARHQKLKCQVVGVLSKSLILTIFLSQYINFFWFLLKKSSTRKLKKGKDYIENPSYDVI